ncbi:MAG: hypothetical protein DRO14_00335 [Thermoprotei archaeon]|nr:MAG: hypothetical protein DRO14_00100 [Thermoprotei archaeon]RLG78596.1 MAG: hypothetical protein DRO14_00335 [Thermoprotei archaeon]
MGMRIIEEWNWYLYDFFWYSYAGFFYVIAVVSESFRNSFFQGCGLLFCLISAIVFFMSSYFILGERLEVPFVLVGAVLCWSFYVFSPVAIAIDSAALLLLGLTLAMTD